MHKNPIYLNIPVKVKFSSPTSLIWPWAFAKIFFVQLFILFFEVENGMSERKMSERKMGEMDVILHNGKCEYRRLRSVHNDGKCEYRRLRIVHNARTISVLVCLVVFAVTPTAHTTRVERRCIWLQSLARAHEVSICFHNGLCVFVCVCAWLKLKSSGSSSHGISSAFVFATLQCTS